MEQNQEAVKFTVSKGMIHNSDGMIMGVLTEDVTEMEEKTIEASGDALEAIAEFIKGIESGTHKPKAAYNRFKAILEKYDL